MQLKIQELLKTNDFDAATAILDEKDIRWKIESSPVTGRRYLHLDYGIKCTKDDIMTKECRGLALMMETWDIVRFGFYRFMNLGEGGCDIAFDDDDQFEYDEKADGSIIILSHFDGRWVAGSRGVIFPSAPLENGLTLEQMFWVIASIPQSHEIWDTKLDKNICYIFELCSMANRIVIPYEKAQLVLLGARKKDENWKELNTSELDALMGPIDGTSRFRRPEPHSFPSILECVEHTKDLHGFKEGFVIKRWNDHEGRFDRAKIKGRAYLDLHHVVSGLSIRNLARMAVFGDRENLETFPEYLYSYDAVAAKIAEHCSYVTTAYQEACKSIEGIEDEREKKKAFAMSLRERPDFQKINGACFAMLNGKVESVREMLQKKSDRSGMKNLVENLNLKVVAGEKWIDAEDTDEDN